MRLPLQVLVYVASRKPTGWHYLLLRRISTRNGHWQGVTGGVEPGETLLQAARRELSEETGFVPSRVEQVDYSYSFPVGHQWRHLYAESVTHVAEYVFVAEVDAHRDPKIDPSEHDMWKWCDVTDALELLKWAENKEALRRCDNLLLQR